MKSPLEHIEHLRTQPEHVRRRVTMLATCLIASFVFFVWLGNTRAELSLVPEHPDTVLDQTKQDFAQIASPFVAFKDAIASLFGGDKK